MDLTGTCWDAQTCEVLTVRVKQHIFIETSPPSGGVQIYTHLSNMRFSIETTSTPTTELNCTAVTMKCYAFSQVLAEEINYLV